MSLVVSLRKQLTGGSQPSEREFNGRPLHGRRGDNDINDNYENNKKQQ